jgi:hypothetical protein
MQTAEQLYKLAKSCRDWAVMAENDSTRRVFLQWAQEWTDVALRVDGAELLTSNKAAIDQTK